MHSYKPCPFCADDEPVLHYKRTDTGQDCWVECRDCGCIGPKAYSQKTAQQIWNKRLYNATFIPGKDIPHSGADRIGRSGLMIYNTNEN